jgi:hypothetical protein
MEVAQNLVLLDASGDDLLDAAIKVMGVSVLTH